MRAYRKRTWASLVVNMTPLIDVVFLIIIFFIMLINFSEILIREVKLPEADQAKEPKPRVIKEISITIKSGKIIYVDQKAVSLDNLARTLSQKIVDPRRTTVLLRGDENIPYDTVQEVMEKMASSGLSRIEFSIRQESKPQREKEPGDEASD